MIMKENWSVPFRETYASKDRVIDTSSPEIRLIEAFCKRDEKAASSLFEEEKQFGGKSMIYAPHGIFQGLSGVNQLANTFLSRFEASSATVYPVVQVRASGRSVTELTVALKREKGDLEIPMLVASDLRPNGKMDEARIYFFSQWVDGFSPYRKPIFTPSYQKCAEYPLMTGSVRAYFEALHTEGGIERIMDICEDDILYGGYRPEGSEKIMVGKKELREVYEGICAEAPRKYSVRGEALTDDGVNCVVEWTLIVTEEGAKEGFVPVAGVAVYERTDNGKLKSIRICDDNGYLDLIDKTKYPELAAYL